MRRRITPIPVNSKAKIHMALRKVLANQQRLLKKAATLKRITNLSKNITRQMYINALIAQRPNATAYQRRLAGRVKNVPNIDRLLFGKKKNN
jgi:hypothetical protein